MLNEVSEELEAHSMSIEVSQEAKQYILDKSYEKKYGARPLRRAIQKMIENQISDMILRGKYKSGNTIKVTLNDGQLEFN